MYKKIFLILFLSLSTYASETLTLSTPKTNAIKDENITLNITPSNINPKDITWIIKPKNSLHVNNLTITPIKDTTITLKAKYKNKISNPITISVKWIVNGHTLPPKPNEKINNSTLLGIDVNSNGVRDDVERWIYETYHHPIERGIFMQSARAYQKVIVEPKKAHENVKYLTKFQSCKYYFLDTNEYISKKYEYKHMLTKLDLIQFNTSKRYLAYDKYNREFHGEIFGLPKASKDNCEFDKNGNLK